MNIFYLMQLLAAFSMSFGSTPCLVSHEPPPSHSSSSIGTEDQESRHTSAPTAFDWGKFQTPASVEAARLRALANRTIAERLSDALAGIPAGIVLAAAAVMTHVGSSASLLALLVALGFVLCHPMLRRYLFVGTCVSSVLVLLLALG